MDDKILLKELCKKYPSTKDIRLNSFELFKKIEVPGRKEKGWENSQVKINLENLKYAEGKIELKINEEDKKNVFLQSLNDSNELEIGQLIEEKDKFAMMHNALWNNGYVLKIKKNTTLNSPIIIKYSGKENTILNHIILFVEEGASLSVIEEHCSEKCLRNDAIEIYLEKNSCLNFYSITKDDDTTSLSKVRSKLEEGSKMNVFFSFSGKSFVRQDYKILLEGKNTQSNISGIYVGENNVFDITTDVVHIEKNTSSEILVKGVLKDNAKSMHRGKIKILKDASKTSSFLEGRSLMLGQDSVSDIIPSLEIDTNDVKASHAATIGRPDEEDIFYLMSRGLNKKDAEKLITAGFFSDIIERIPDMDIRDEFISRLKGDIVDKC